MKLREEKLEKLRAEREKQLNSIAQQRGEGHEVPLTGFVEKVPLCPPILLFLCRFPVFHVIVDFNCKVSAGKDYADLYLKHPGDGDADDGNGDDDDDETDADENGTKEYRPYDDEMSGPLNFQEYIAEQKRRNITKSVHK